MSQKITLDSIGVVGIPLGCNLKDIINLKIQPFTQLEDSNKFRVSLIGNIEYYSVALYETKIDKLGDLDNMFLVFDKEKRLIKIKLFFKYEEIDFFKKLKDIFGKNPLIAKSGIGLNDSNFLAHWKLGKNKSCFYKKLINHPTSSVTISINSEEAGFADIVLKY